MKIQEDKIDTIEAESYEKIHDEDMNRFDFAAKLLVNEEDIIDED